MANSASRKIGFIVCSQRVPPAGHQITEFVLSTVQNAHPSANLSLIDLASWSLPMCDEPGIPSEITDSGQYSHAHTRRWSAEISSYSAFVFVTPQYNWSFPASIKNAIDYLYYEWKGKPAMIVSYGSRGGGAAAGQLNQVLMGVRMRPIEARVALAFPGKPYLIKAASGGDLKLDHEDEAGVWSGQLGKICNAFVDLLRAVEDSGKASDSAAATHSEK
jgi:NAD(P)H-dependent FMN reductase